MIETAEARRHGSQREKVVCLRAAVSLWFNFLKQLFNV